MPDLADADGTAPRLPRPIDALDDPPLLPQANELGVHASTASAVATDRTMASVRLATVANECEFIGDRLQRDELRTQAVNVTIR